jgi:hypothetical protein
LNRYGRLRFSYLNIIVFDAKLIDWHGFYSGPFQGFACLDVENGRVQGASNVLAFKLAFYERTAHMRARIAKGMVGAVHVGHDDGLSREVDQLHLADGDLRHLNHGLEVCHIEPSLAQAAIIS